MFQNKDMEKKYVIINRNLVEAIDFKQVIETSESTLRYSLDGTQTIIKFIGAPVTFHNPFITALTRPITKLKNLLIGSKS